MTRVPKRVLDARSQCCSRLRARLTEQRSITDAIAPTWLSFLAGGVPVPGCRPGRAVVLHPTPVAADARHARRAGAGQAVHRGGGGPPRRLLVLGLDRRTHRLSGARLGIAWRGAHGLCAAAP